MIRNYPLSVKHLDARLTRQDAGLIPRHQAPRITRRASLNTLAARAPAGAIIAICDADAPQLLRSLPQPGAWEALHRRERAQPQTARSTALPGRTPCIAALGYARRQCTQYERLTLAGQLCRQIAAQRPGRIAVVLDEQLADATAWHEALVSALLAHSFTMPDFRSKPPAPWTVQQIDLYRSPPLPLRRIAATARATNLVRWLTALPPNVLTSQSYRRLLQSLARRHGLSFRWYSEAQLKRLGAGAFLAVSRANHGRDAGIACLRWNGRRGAATRRVDAALVGKGILFDTGGVNLKPFRSMLDMHTDMAGSAVAIASLVALAELRASRNVEAWLAITENNIGPEAYRPQEIVRALNGTTIQVIHSDAEGRMVLADTLALAARSRPLRMIDFATLTGSCVHALTERYSGVFATRANLLGELIAAGMSSGERLWAFPLDDDFDHDIESTVADVRQCAVDGKGDHILATRFLKRFVPDAMPWAHIDLSAATRTGGLAHVPSDATGFGARLVLQWLLGKESAT